MLTSMVFKINIFKEHKYYTIDIAHGFFKSLKFITFIYTLEDTHNILIHIR